MLLTLLLIPVIGSTFAFSLKRLNAKYISLILAFLEMGLSFYMLSKLDFTRTIDSQNLQYEIITPESSFLKTSLYMGIDGLSMLFILLTTILTVIIILSSYSQPVPYKNTFYGLILLMEFGLIGVFTSLDGLMFYAFWEITLIPIWFICGLWGQENQKIQFTTKFFIYTFIASLFMLGGLIYTYNHSASFSLLDMYNSNLNTIQQTVVFWFIFIAFAVKLPVFPFHTWQPDTYTYSPTEGTNLLSGIMLKMAIFGLLRYLLPITPDAIKGTSGTLVLVLAIISIVYGALIAIVKNDIKRIIAYSSLSHIGLILAGIFSSAIVTLTDHFTIEGAKGAVIQSFSHGINIVGLFYCADILYRRFKTRDMREMGGLAKVAPKFATLFLIIVFGAMSVPLTSGFIGEFILLKSIFDYNTIAVIISGLTVILCSVYMLRIYGKSMFGKGDKILLASIKDVSSIEFSVLASLIVFIIFLGIFPNSILQIVHSSLEFIFKSMNN